MATSHISVRLKIEQNRGVTEQSSVAPPGASVLPWRGLRRMLSSGSEVCASGQSWGVLGLAALGGRCAFRRCWHRRQEQCQVLGAGCCTLTLREGFPLDFLPTWE